MTLRLALALGFALLSRPALAWDLQEANAKIAWCADMVRRADPYSHFDAYRDPATLHIRYMGTARENWQFEKCMALHGVPLSDIKQ
jgi:hypothetical protein